MADRMTPEQRHRCMAAVKGADTKPEMLVRRWLWAQGFRYRLHVKRLPGKPDIGLHRYHTVINVNGCFWHGHEGCSLYRLPKSNTAYWQDKIDRNRQRDAENLAKLKSMGWYVVNLWECDLAKNRREETLLSLSRVLSQIYLKIKGVCLYADKVPSQDVAAAAEPAVPYQSRH